MSETLATSLPQFYLVIARYNIDKTQHILDTGKKNVARDAALTLFPIDSDSVSSITPSPAWERAHAFDTGLLREVDPRTLPQRPPPQSVLDRISPIERLRQSVEAFRGKPLNGAHQHVSDPGMGWMAIVAQQDFADFYAKLDGPLGEMYDVEIIPLRGTTTDDVYWLMTPLHWN